MAKLGVIEECDVPDDGCNIAGSTLVCKIKRLWNGAIDKYRVRWVMQGFSQTFGLDFFETAAPVVMGAVVRIVAAIMTVVPNCEAWQCDVSVAYLRCKLDEKLYMWPPKCVPPLPVNPKTGKKQCYAVKSTIYGCKQAANYWYRKCSKEQFLDNGFTKCPFDSCLFVKRHGSFFLIAVLYVDDCYFVGNWPEELAKFKASFVKNFEIKEFNEIKWFLGWHFERDLVNHTCRISQPQFIIDALKRFELEDFPATRLPCPTSHVFDELDDSCLLDKKQQKLFMEMTGTLNYLCTSSRADIAWVTSKLGMYMNQADAHQLKSAVQVFTYLKGTKDQGITLRRSAGLEPVAYSDASHGDHGKCSNGRRRSQSGCSVKVGGAAAVYYSRGQKNVALSTAEAEYVALSSCVQETIWVRRILTFLGFPPKGPTRVYEDNEAAEHLANNDLMTKRSRFVDVRFHYTREMVKEREIEVVRCPTTDMQADLFTKALPAVLLSKHWDATRGETSPQVPVVACVVQLGSKLE
jgi:hypothetical protein